MITTGWILYGLFVVLVLGMIVVLVRFVGPDPTCPRCGAGLRYETILMPMFIGEMMLLMPTQVPTGGFMCGHG